MAKSVDAKDFEEDLKQYLFFYVYFFHFNVLFILYKGTDYEKGNRQRRICKCS